MTIHLLLHLATAAVGAGAEMFKQGERYGFIIGFYGR